MTLIEIPGHLIRSISGHLKKTNKDEDYIHVREKKESILR